MPSIVGTGDSGPYEQFREVLNDLSANFSEKNTYIKNLCRVPLLILDDFGMERGTEYGLEQIYAVIDGRYRSGKPLIATTNLTLQGVKESAGYSACQDL